MTKLFLIIILILFLAGVFYVCKFLWRIVRGEKYKEAKFITEQSMEPDSGHPNINSKVAGVALGIAGASLLWYTWFYEPTAKYELTAIQLYNEFSENKIAAFSKYKDNYVILTGEYIGGDMLEGRPAILLKTNAWRDKIICVFSSKDAEEAASLNKLQNIRLKGRVLGKDKNIILDNCSIPT